MDHGGREERSILSCFSVFRDVWHTLAARNMMVFHESTHQSEARWHRGRIFDPSLTDYHFLFGRVFLCGKSQSLKHT